MKQETRRILENTSTASIATMVGTTEEGGVMTIWKCPPRPMAAIIDRIITNITTTTPVNDRNKSPVTIRITRYISGTKVVMSWIEATLNASLSITAPVILIDGQDLPAVFIDIKCTACIDMPGA